MYNSGNCFYCRKQDGWRSRSLRLHSRGSQGFHPPDAACFCRPDKKYAGKDRSADNCAGMWKRSYRRRVQKDQSEQQYTPDRIGGIRFSIKRNEHDPQPDCDKYPVKHQQFSAWHHLNRILRKSQIMRFKICTPRLVLFL